MIAAVVQARRSSTRLPGKVLLPVCGEPMLARQLDRIARVAGTEVVVVVATSDEASDDAVARLAADCGVRVHRGSLRDVLGRVHDAAASVGAEHVVRLTGDCPLTDPGVIEEVIRLHLASRNDYTSNVLERTYPDGLDVEVVRYAALARAAREAVAEPEREHVTPFVYSRPDAFKIGHLRGDADLSGLRWVVDEREDYEFVCAVYEHLLARSPAFSMEEVLKLLTEFPELAELNARHDGSGAWPEEVARALMPVGQG